MVHDGNMAGLSKGEVEGSKWHLERPIGSLHERKEHSERTGVFNYCKTRGYVPYTLALISTKIMDAELRWKEI
jgi:hypothetical protein